MTTELDLTDPKDLERWLKDKPVEWSQGIAARAALRVFPVLFVGGADNAELGKLILAATRAMLISWIARKFPTHNMIAAAAAAYASARAADAASYAARASTHAAAATAYYAAAGAAGAAHAARAATLAARAAVHAAGAHAAGAADDDARWLEGHKGERFGEGALIDQPLWLNVRRRSPAVEWHIAFRGGIVAEHGFFPWIAWYDALLPADPAAAPFDYFGEALTLRIATQPDAWWDRPPKDVNADIARWLEERDAAPKESEIAEDAIRSVPDETPAPFPLGWREGKIAATLPDPVAGDGGLAQVLLDGTREKADVLAARLERTNAAGRVKASVDALRRSLPAQVADLHPGVLRLRAVSLHADATGYLRADTEGELPPDALAGLIDLSETLRDLQGCFPSLRKLDAEIIALNLKPGDADAVKRHLDAMTETAAASSAIVDDSAVEGLRTLSAIAAEDAPDDVRATRVAGYTLNHRNLVSMALREAIALSTDGIKGAGRTMRSVGASAEAMAPHLFVASICEMLAQMHYPLSAIAVFGLTYYDKLPRLIEFMKEANKLKGPGGGGS